jgi:hypothetical protein
MSLRDSKYITKIVIDTDSQAIAEDVLKHFDRVTILERPEAAVYHSHNFSLIAVFQKHFDCGASFSQFASDEYATDKFTAEGLAYVKEKMKFLISKGYIKWLPYAMLYDLAKFLGVTLGKRAK